MLSQAAALRLQIVGESDAFGVSRVEQSALVVGQGAIDHAASVWPRMPRIVYSAHGHLGTVHTWARCSLRG